MSLYHSTIKSFPYAISGLKIALKREPNIKVHLFAATVAIILAIFLKLSVAEWILLTITITMVIVLELINTAIEAIVNLVSPEIKDEAKVAKDVSAAAVLIASLASIFIGLFLFLSKIL